jgi:hypothetical protein
MMSNKSVAIKRTFALTEEGGRLLALLIASLLRRDVAIRTQTGRDHRFTPYFLPRTDRLSLLRNETS